MTAVKLIATVPRSGTNFIQYFLHYYNAILKFGYVPDEILDSSGKPFVEMDGIDGINSIIVGHTYFPGVDITCPHSIYFQYEKLPYESYYDPIKPIVQQHIKSICPLINKDARIVFIYRNPLDQVISIRKQLRNSAITRDDKVLVTLLQDESKFYEKFLLMYTKLYWSFRIGKHFFPDNVCFIQYERLFDDTTVTLHQILEYLGHNIEPYWEEFEKAVQLTKPENMKNIEKRIGHSLANNRREGYKTESHIRRGKPGEWQDVYGSDWLEKETPYLKSLGLEPDEFIFSLDSPGKSTSDMEAKLRDMPFIMKGEYLEPLLIEEGFKFYNIVAYKNKYYGISQTLGCIDFSTANYSNLPGVIVESSRLLLKQRISEESEKTAVTEYSLHKKHNKSLIKSSCQYFLVTSQGLTATRWLSFVLASNSKVFVAHGHYPLSSVIKGNFHREKTIGDIEALTMGTELQSLYKQKKLQEIYEVYHTVMPEAKVYGGVHTYVLNNLMGSKGDSLPQLKILNSIRHPVGYISSHSGMVKTANQNYLRTYTLYKKMYEEALVKHPEIALTDKIEDEEFIAFVVSCLSVSYQINDLMHSEYQHIKMERFTVDVNLLQEICWYLTGLKYDEQKLKSMIEAGAINKHRKQGNTTQDPQAIYNSWEIWKQDLAHIMLSTELLDKFEENGYNVSMLRAKSNKVTVETKTLSVKESKFQQGNRSRLNGQLIEAIASYRQVINQNQNFSWSYHKIGNVLLKLGDTEEAINAYNSALKIKPRSATSHLSLGDALEKKGSLDEAIAHYKTAVELKPDSLLPQKKLAKLELRRSLKQITCHASSTLEEMYRAQNLFWGDVMIWHSQSPPQYPEWLEFELPQPQKWHGISIKPQQRH
ncbi:MAG: tetratricopeptide repeat protein, partial [Trichodesmium sp. MAG_R04]|nr:tetratricopeptide repeat protein [Trichodesmium sp. MAG_R04]